MERFVAGRAWRSRQELYTAVKAGPMFRGLGFRVWGFRVWGFGVLGVWGFRGLGVWGFRV